MIVERLASTLSQQRSFTGDWLVSGDISGIPQGVITDLSVVTVSNSPVYLGELTIQDGKAYITLSQEGKVCAYGELTSDSSVYALEAVYPILSASVTTGSIPNSTLSFMPTLARISPELVSYVKAHRAALTSLTVVQDGEETTYTVSTDIEINLDTYFQGHIANGALVISVSDDDYRSFQNITGNIISEPPVVTKINGIRSNSGVLYITIQCDNTLLPITVVENIASVDGSEVNLCPLSVDPIDKKLLPSLKPEYRPLDDAYTINDGKYERDVTRLLDLDYDILPGCEEMKLTDVDKQVDGGV